MLKNDTYSNSVSSLPKKYEQSVYIINKRAFFGNDILLYSRYKQKQTYIHSCKSMLSLLSILSDKKLCIISLTKRVQSTHYAQKVKFLRSCRACELLNISNVNKSAHAQVYKKNIATYHHTRQPTRPPNPPQNTQPTS